MKEHWPSAQAAFWIRQMFKSKDAKWGMVSGIDNLVFSENEFIFPRVIQQISSGLSQKKLVTS